MQVAGCERTYNVHSRDNEPAIVVEPGEAFRVRTQLNGGGWLASIQQVIYNAGGFLEPFY